ncbi:MAG: hypothetical protein DWQ34_23580 [Planctomycetota bacterium]|nr:MAG: hypothetical protein DWQ29_18720 [Planctomycetota bacterium]REJ87921.1 MAG: hypothetical protein DWQ34_23580 [Planctomycetota bacterium]REK23247.1 MAG: hypothetical protein DWQ41_17645 [Planctomycetota bacterium]REK30832.1 MAG: hypothetical protein DWQ45_20540 [Planctomycetota bacterium]
MDKELSILQRTNRCRHLESKGMYINIGMPAGEEAAGDGYVWCARTQGKFGPDNGLCNPDECCRGERTCFAPL